MEIFLIAAWELWKIRNRLVFDGVKACFNRCGFETSRRRLLFSLTV
jgi:hypothetical protein